VVEIHTLSLILSIKGLILEVITSFAGVGLFLEFESTGSSDFLPVSQY